MANRMTRLALLDSEVFCELERMTKEAQSLADKIVNTPSAQKAITDGITKALTTNSADDDRRPIEHEQFREHMKKLTDHEAYEFSKMFADELKDRGIDPLDFEPVYEEEELDQNGDDEKKEEKDIESVFAHTISRLTKLAHIAADSGNTPAAYIIERHIKKILQRG